MTRRGILIIACCAGVLAVCAPASEASLVHDRACTANVTWSLTTTSATKTITNLVCYRADAAAALSGLFPEWSVSGKGEVVPGPYTTTYAYTPIVGFCDGTLASTDPAYTATGVLKNDGNFHSVVQEVIKSTSSPDWATVATSVAALQNACSPTWQGTIAYDYVYASP